MRKLSSIQQKVMEWANGGHTLYQAVGSSIYVNNKYLCNRVTVDVLIKMGLLIETQRWQFKKREQHGLHRR